MSEFPYKKAGALLDDIRLSRGLTITTIVTQLGIKFEDYFDWETGKTRPSALQVGRLIEILDPHPVDCKLLSKYWGVTP